jgi:hypothetical protein
VCSSDLSFKTKSGGYAHQVVLEEGDYYLSDFIKELQNKMNNVLWVDSDVSGQIRRDTGFSWTISKVQQVDGVINIKYGFERTDNINITNSNSTFNDVMDYSGSNFIKTGADDGSYNGYVFANTFSNNGGFLCSTIITQQGTQPIANAQWIFGLDANFQSRESTTQSTILNNMLVAIGNTGSGKYSIKLNGEFVETSTTVLANDKIQIYKDEGKIIYKIRNSIILEGDEVQEKLPKLGTTELGLILHVGNNGANIGFSAIYEFPNPNVVSSSGVFSIIDSTNDNVYLNTNLSATATLITLTLPNTEVSRLLGFTKSPDPIDRVKDAFIGNRGIEIKFFADDLIVELQEVSSINTYVEDFKATRNAIMIIPAADLIGSVKASSGGFFTLSWTEQANFTFIDLSNIHDLQLTALTIRVTSNGRLLNMAGKMSALLLIQSKENK